MSDPQNTSAENTGSSPVISEECIVRADQEAVQRPSPSFTLKELSIWFAFGMPALCLLMVVIEASSYIWRPIAVILYIGLLLLGVYLIEQGNSTIDNFFGVLPIKIGSAFLRIILFTDESFAKNKASVRVRNQLIEIVEKLEKEGEELQTDLEKIDLQYYSADKLALTLLGCIAVLVGFSQVSRHLSFLIGGFISEGTGYWHWIRFGFSNLLESVLFDVPAIFEWDLSEIRATSTWSRTIVFIFRLAIEFLVVAMILRQVRIAPRKLRITHREQPNNYFALILPKLGQLTLTALWVIPIMIGIVAVFNDGIATKAILSVIKLGVPLVFGLWLAWHSLHGLALPGLKNKLFAFVGIVSGFWLVQEYWIAFYKILGQ